MSDSADKNIEYYLNLPWSYTLEKITDNDGYFYIRVNELNCFSDGDTPEEAFKNIQEALNLHIKATLKEGGLIPEPVKPEDFKGQMAYRTKPEKHFRIAKEAQKRNLSINKLIDAAVEAYISA